MTTKEPLALKIPRSVLVIIYTQQLDTLLLERVDFPGFWQSVTGSQEPGESFVETAAREAAEETGIYAAEHGDVEDLHCESVFNIYPRWRHRYPPETTHNRECCFALRLSDRIEPVLAPREHTAFQWLPIRQAIEQVHSWSNALALRKLLQIRASRV